MEKKNTYSKWMAVVLLACVCGLVSCRAEYEVTKVEGTRVAMDATWDAEPDKGCPGAAGALQGWGG